MNGESTQRQSAVKVAYISCPIYSSACNKDRTAGGCAVKRQVSSRLGEAVLSVTLTECSVTVSLWRDSMFQQCKSIQASGHARSRRGSRIRLQYGQRANEARVLNLHVAHPVTRALRGCLSSSLQPATLSPF